MKIKTSELIGPALDWAVAKCEGVRLSGASLAFQVKAQGTVSTGWLPYSPSTNWAQGGPIIERLAGFHIKHWIDIKPDMKFEAHLHNYDGNWIEFGPTYLVAAMRCYVASKLGDEVEVPEGLV